ncbi:hypothetical protein [Rufibacter roseus]|uniref:Uncharacterized protein n=1 Tax=Rufibacter roseus TaxID=1567108 RepID=A0ABW2DMS5_9BACT|nr:hypothetical protein [Rufibacter roseus]
MGDARTGNCPSSDCTILADIVWQAQGNLARTSEVNHIASQVIEALSALNARPTNDLGGFEVNRHYLESSNTLNESNGSHVIIRRLLRFRDLVFETVTT